MQEYKNDKLVVRYDPAICIHAGECVRGLPSVFTFGGPSLSVYLKKWRGMGRFPPITPYQFGPIIR